MDWTISHSVVHWLDNRNTKRTGIPGRGGTLPGHNQDTAPSWLTSKKSSIQPSVMILGASTMQKTLPSSLSLTVATPAEGTVMADVESIHSVSSSIDPSDRSQVDVTTAPLISVPAQVESQIVEIDLSCVIHPFYIHKMDSGPVRLMTIAHAFNYRVTVLRDGVRLAV